jgi:hypothetical protein
MTPMWADSFAAALLNPALPAPGGLAAPPGASSLQARLAVHRNTVVHSLVQVLGEAFPVLLALLGDDCFKAVAADFVREQPPRSPVMAEYGDGLAPWLEACPALAGHPWLGDVARLEYSRQRAMHAADAQALPDAALQARLADSALLATTTLRLHPSLQLLRLRHAAVSLWHAHQLDDQARDARVAELEAGQPEQALVLRDRDDEVCVIPLPAAEAALAAALLAGRPLGVALENGADAEAATLVTLLALLLRHGAITGLGQTLSEYRGL